MVEVLTGRVVPPTAGLGWSGSSEPPSKSKRSHTWSNAGGGGESSAVGEEPSKQFDRKWDRKCHLGCFCTWLAGGCGSTTPPCFTWAGRISLMVSPVASPLVWPGEFFSITGILSSTAALWKQGPSHRFSNMQYGGGQKAHDASFLLGNIPWKEEKKLASSSSFPTSCGHIFWREHCIQLPSAGAPHLCSCRRCWRCFWCDWKGCRDEKESETLQQLIRISLTQRYLHKTLQTQEV